MTIWRRFSCSYRANTRTVLLVRDTQGSLRSRSGRRCRPFPGSTELLEIVPLARRTRRRALCRHERFELPAAPAALVFEQGHSAYCSRGPRPWSEAGATEHRGATRGRRAGFLVPVPRSRSSNPAGVPVAATATIGGAVSTQVYHNRRATVIENDVLRVVVLEEGGHIAAIVDKASGINPLWQPPWPSIEPSEFTDAHEPLYGSGADARLLAGIMGHNLCLDIFGGPSDEEAAAGRDRPRRSLRRPLSDRWLGRDPDDERDAAARADRRSTTDRSRGTPGSSARVGRKSRRHGPADRMDTARDARAAVSGTGTTEFRLPATRSKVFDGTFGPADDLKAGAEFEWPLAPLKDGGTRNLQPATRAPISSAYSAHLLDPSARSGVVCGVLAGGAARLRVRLAPRGFSVGRHLGRKQQPHALAVERADPSREPSSSASRRFPNRVVRWWRADASSGSRRSGGCPRNRRSRSNTGRYCTRPSRYSRSRRWPDAGSARPPQRGDARIGGERIVDRTPAAPPETHTRRARRARSRLSAPRLPIDRLPCQRTRGTPAARR